MPPNRKKKRPPSNPARGFATTSTTSKSKLGDDAALQEEDLPIATIKAEPILNRPYGPADIRKSEKELSELTPEELEKQLEESELQLLLEKYGEKTKKDITRQVGRLETERRLLRSQAEKLNTSWFLPEELVIIITDHLRNCLSSTMLSTSRDATSNSTLVEEDLSIQIFALRRILIDLGFTGEKAHQAVSYLLQNARLRDQATTNVSKETLWGLDQCLEWLALMCSPEEVPDYETHLTRAKERKTTCKSSYIEFPIGKGHTLFPFYVSII